MSFKKIMVGLLIVGLGSASGIQLYATTTSNKNIKTDVVYTVKDTPETTDTQNDVEEIYNEKCFKILEDCFNTTRDKLPKDAKFIVFLMSKDNLDKEEAHWLQVCQDELNQHKISPEEYAKRKDRLKKEYDRYRNNIAKLNHDVVSCSLSVGDGTNFTYDIEFNANTKEVTYGMVPLSDKGWEMLTSAVDGKSKPQISAAIDEKNKTFGINYIKEHHLGNIQNPEFVKLAGTTHGRFLYQDALDPSKKIVLFFDNFTHEVNMFDISQNAINTMTNE